MRLPGNCRCNPPHPVSMPDFVFGADLAASCAVVPACRSAARRPVLGRESGRRRTARFTRAAWRRGLGKRAGRMVCFRGCGEAGDKRRERLPPDSLPTVRGIYAVRRRRSGWRTGPAARWSLGWRGSSLIRSGSRRRAGGVGARGTVRLTRSCCAGASRPRSRLHARDLSGCSRRCTVWGRISGSRSRPARRTSGGRRSGARAACRVSGSGCRPDVHAVAGARGCDD